MNIKTIKWNGNIVLDSYDKKQLYDIVRLQKVGESYSPGRTCYYRLKYPIMYENVLYYSVKIKGAGFYDTTNEVIAPGKTAFVRREPHYGFDDKGNAIKVFSDIAPFGGIVLSKAIREYDNFDLLSRNNVSTLFPLAVIEYESLLFEQEKLAVIMALCTEKFPLRMYRLLWPAERLSKTECDYYNFLLKKEEIDGNIFQFKARAELIQKLATKYTSEIRKFSECGLYIHSGGWSNIQYNSQINNIVLVDLDSSRCINRKQYSMRNLYAIRDFISNMYRLLISLYNPNIISQYNEDIIRDKNYIFYLLAGFFSNESIEVLMNVSDDILDFYINNCFNDIKAIEYKMNNLSQCEVERYELSMFEFYDFCFEKFRVFIKK